MRVLIVDDDEGISNVLSRSLSRWGWSFDAENTVAGALRAFADRHYDLAVCDVDLPDGDGIDMAHAMLKVKPTTRILMLSGDPRNLERARDTGLSECLPKPFELDLLKSLVETLPAT